MSAKMAPDELMTAWLLIRVALAMPGETSIPSG